ncbi:hypothetical protein vseg_007400 [Gypsophila vaccaria]
MNETVVNWVIEFLLRQRIDENIINGVISSLSTEIGDYRVKKTMLLRKIEIEASNGCISEQILELIEKIEALDQEKGKFATNVMKNAYCLVAVDCTVRFLVENVEDNAKYMEVVENLWRNRVCKSERLVSEELKRWFFDIEAAVENSDVYRKIWNRNTRNEALKAVREYLTEAWECLGLSFLESMAVKWRNESSELCGVVGGAGYPCRELRVVEGTEKGQASVRREHVAVKGRSHEGPIISDAGKAATPKVVRQMKEPKSNTIKRPRLVDHLSDNFQTAQTSSSTEHLGTVTQNQMRSDTPTIMEAERLQKAHEMARKTKTDMNNDAGVCNKAGTEMDAPNDSNENDPENAKEDAVKENSRGYSSLDHGIQNKVRNQNLLEPNDTSHTLDWDDEIEKARLGSPLLNPKALRSFSPFQYRNLQRRRERKMWTPQEEDALREGVQKYGKGNWKMILTDNKFRQVFQGRIEVDLKDKWRNLTR